MKTITKRLTLGLLALSLLGGYGVLLAPSAEASSLNPVNSTLTYYEWQRAYEDDTKAKDSYNREYNVLPNSTSEGWVRAMIIWEDGGENYFLSGNTIEMTRRSWTKNEFRYITSNKKTSVDSYIDIGAESFITVKGHNTPFIRYTGQSDSDNNYAPMFQIQLSNSSDNNSGHYLFDDDCFRQTNEEDYRDDVDTYSKRYWTFRDRSTTWADESLYNKDIPSGHFLIFYAEPGGYDGGFLSNANWLRSLNKFDTTAYTDLKIFIGRQRKLLAIGSNFELNPGQNLRIDDNVALMGGVKLTLNKGSSLTIAGRFYNNGEIINKGGTIILKEGARILPLDPNNKSAGSIECSEGDIVLMKDSRILCADGAYLKLKKSSTCVMDKNSVLAVCGNFTVEGQSFIDNRGGAIFANYSVSRPFTFSGATLTMGETAALGNLYPMGRNSYSLTVKENSMIINDVGGRLMMHGDWSVDGGSYILSKNNGRAYSIDWINWRSEKDTLTNAAFWPATYLS